MTQSESREPWFKKNVPRQVTSPDGGIVLTVRCANVVQFTRKTPLERCLMGFSGDSVRDTDAYVCPVAIQSLVENAIRHNKHGKNAPLEICLYCENDYMVVDNTYAPIDIPSLKTGNQNLSRRYKILAGKEIQALQENGIYRVKIPLLTYKDIKNEDSDN